MTPQEFDAVRIFMRDGISTDYAVDLSHRGGPLDAFYSVVADELKRRRA